MEKKLKPIISYLLQISFRERLLLLLIILAIIYAVWDALIYSPQINQHAQLVKQQQQLADKKLDNELRQAENMALSAQESRSKSAIKQSITSTKLELEKNTKELNSILQSLVPPTKITELLHSLFLQTHGLKLISLNNDPVETITINSEQQQPSSVENQQADPYSTLYKHSTTMVLSGNFQQLYEYLLMIEKSTWSLYWDKLEYQVTSYPNAKITIRVHTISTDQYWIGL
jgi:MSHA biogenesis protein MshJ